MSVLKEFWRSFASQQNVAQSNQISVHISKTQKITI